MPTLTRGLAAQPPPVPAGSAKLRVFDDKLSGFIMEVRASGLVSFYIRYRDVRGRQREVRIGRLGEVTIDQARKRAGEIKAAASLGGDPAADRDRLREVPTFRSFVVERYLPYAKERLRSFRDHEAFFRLRLDGLWGTRRLDEVRPADVAELQARLRREGLSNATVNRYVAFAKRVFNLALRWEAYEGRNPAQHAEMRREQHRERYLSQDELRALFRALDEEPNRTAAGIIALLAISGARRGEAMNARWEQIDFDRRLWTVPLSKSGKRRHIPLSDGAVQVITRLPRLEGSPWLFPNRDGTGPMLCVKKAWDRAKRQAGIAPDFRLHDLRHTFASLLAGKGRSLQEIGQLLGHASMTMTLRYAHLTPSRLLEAANLVTLD